MRVGMNRITLLEWQSSPCVPHACGDEPVGIVGTRFFTHVFPMRVGMNRTGCVCIRGL